MDQREAFRFVAPGVRMPVSLSGCNIGSKCAKVEKVRSLFPGPDMIVFSEPALHGPLESWAFMPTPIRAPI